MSTDTQRAFIQDLLKEIQDLKNEIHYLKHNPPKRTQSLDKHEKLKRKAMCDGRWAKGGIWFHRSKQYNDTMSDTAVKKYHKENPEAKIGKKGEKLGIGKRDK